MCTKGHRFFILLTHISTRLENQLTSKYLASQLEAVDGCGIVFPVSIWMKKLTWEDKPRCIAVMEPVERKVAVVMFDSKVGA